MDRMARTAKRKIQARREDKVTYVPVPGIFFGGVFCFLFAYVGSSHRRCSSDRACRQEDKEFAARRNDRWAPSPLSLSLSLPLARVIRLCLAFSSVEK